MVNSLAADEDATLQKEPDDDQKFFYRADYLGRMTP
jgi:hypothetical protein